MHTLAADFTVPLYLDANWWVVIYLILNDPVLFKIQSQLIFISVRQSCLVVKSDYRFRGFFHEQISSFMFGPLDNDLMAKTNFTNYI